MKAILVIDIPNNLKYEDLYFEGRILYTTKKDIEFKFLKELSMCSLKPMPSRMKVDYDTIATCEVTEKVVAMGWNACIDEILGEEE